SGYPDHDSDDDDDDDDDNDSDDDDNNGNTIDNNDYNNNHSIISSYKLENSSDSMRKSAETFQIEPYSGRFLSTHSSQYRKGVHVDNDNDYTDCNSDNNHDILFMFLIACCTLLVIGLFYVLLNARK
ncbi:hypothetical protein WUBG_13214, partial [Wuchereria bancrofti]